MTEETAGDRMRNLRKRYEWSQTAMFPDNRHSLAVAVEKGRNKMSGGKARAAYAAIFGATEAAIVAYHAGNISLDEFVQAAQVKPGDKPAPMDGPGEDGSSPRERTAAPMAGHSGSARDRQWVELLLRYRGIGEVMAAGAAQKVVLGGPVEDVANRAYCIARGELAGHAPAPPDQLSGSSLDLAQADVAELEQNAGKVPRRRKVR